MTGSPRDADSRGEAAGWTGASDCKPASALAGAEKAAASVSSRISAHAAACVALGRNVLLSCFSASMLHNSLLPLIPSAPAPRLRLLLRSSSLQQNEQAQKILREEMEKDRLWRERVAAEAALGSLTQRKAR